MTTTTMEQAKQALDETRDAHNLVYSAEIEKRLLSILTADKPVGPLTRKRLHAFPAARFQNMLYCLLFGIQVSESATNQVFETLGRKDEVDMYRV